MTGEHFKPLDFLRRVTEDTGLSSGERAVMLALTMGTDNQTFKVRRSLSAISRASGVGRQYVSEMLDRPAVARYLESVERGPRAVQIVMRQAPEMSSTATLSTAPPAESTVALQDMTCRPTGHDMSPRATPSAKSAPSAPTSSGDETGTEALADLISQAETLPDVAAYRAFWTEHKYLIQAEPGLIEAWRARGEYLKGL